MLATLALAATLAASDTTVVVAERWLDLTGDGYSERMLLRGQGRLTDSLLMTLTIAVGDEVLYEDAFVVDRVIGFGRSRHVADDREWERVLQFYRDLFADERLTTTRAFVATLPIDPAHPPPDTDITTEEWRDLLRSNPPLFPYSPGGDTSIHLAWTRVGHRFIDLFPCCEE